MAAEGTGAKNRDLGFDNPFGLWANGRAGVMGEVSADAAASAIGFMAPDLVRQLWGSRPDGMTAGDCSAVYADLAVAWGRETLADVDSAKLERLTELADRVADAALPSTGALFAGWRTMPRPDDPAGAATLALQVLRELRGGAHLAAVHAVGLGPHAAIMSVDDPVRGGVAGAARFGWSEPHPDPDPTRRSEAEVLTSRAVAPAFAALGDDGGEFVDLVGEAYACLP